MRVLQPIPGLQVGGAEVVVALLGQELRALGHELVVVALGPASGSWIEDDLRTAGAELHFLGKAPGLDLRVVPRLARLLRATEPDLVHTHLHVLKYLVPARVAWRCPVVHTVHNLADREATRADQRLQSAAFRLGVVPVAIGDAVADSVRALYGRAPGAVVPNGVALPEPAPDARARLRRELGLAEDEPVFLVVGRLNAQKNHAGLVEALVDCPGTLLVAGDGELREELERQVEAAGLRERVRLLGVRSDISEVYTASDVLVLSSHYEGNPLVVMEAMACGLPVIATAVGCVPELVTEGTGWLVPPGEPAALSAAMRRAVGDLGEARGRGAAGARRARERFSAGAMAREYARLYRRLVSSAETE